MSNESEKDKERCVTLAPPAIDYVLLKRLGKRLIIVHKWERK